MIISDFHSFVSKYLLSYTCKIFLVILILLQNTPGAALPKGKPIKGLYRLINGKQDGFEICIIDGPAVRRLLYPEFLYGGNEQRYLFNPKNEIWIDNSISAEEYRYTLAHELNERSLMAKLGYSYAAAHDSSLKLEHLMRVADQKLSREHEEKLQKVSTTDCDRIKGLSDLGDSLELRNIYLQLYSKINDISVWIVNGSAVRSFIYPDFGLSGNEFVFHFIPHNEIWIDAQTSCEEIEFSIAEELKERELMSKGIKYDQAYQQALKSETRMRKEKFKESSAKPPIKQPKFPDRDKGTGDENRK